MENILQFSPLRVATARERKKMSQQTLAGKAGLALSTISLMETGRKEPMVNTLAKVAAALNKKLDYFFV